MAEDHPFEVQLKTDATRKGRYRWLILKYKQAHKFSDVSFATEQEALAAANTRMRKIIATWRIGKNQAPQTPGQPRNGLRRS